MYAKAEENCVMKIIEPRNRFAFNLFICSFCK